MHIIFRIYDAELQQICKHFYNILEVSATTVEALTNITLDKFKREEIPYEINIIGYFSNNANGKASKENFLWSLEEP